MDEQRVREIVREELAKAMPTLQAHIRECLAAGLSRPSALRRKGCCSSEAGSVSGRRSPEPTTGGGAGPSWGAQ